MVDDATRKAQVLIQALPYLKRFHNQYVVVKVGGEAIEDRSVLDSLLTDLVWLEQVGIRPILVHGGGKSINRAMEAAGIEPQWHEGRRVTTDEVMAIVHQEAEKLNRLIVDRLFALGGAAIGMVPPRHSIVFGDRLDEALGLVGRPTHVDRERLIRYASRGLIPVVPPLSVAASGHAMNTNADDVALAMATAIDASKLLFCSSVPGVLTDPADPNTRIPSLTDRQVRTLTESGTISGGMIPKVESCIAALRKGVGKIHIVAAAQQHALLLEIFTAEGIGTELTLAEPVAST